MASGHLLVIDDSPTVLKVIELALSKAGYVVTTAADDEAALTLVREARTVPDLILLDGLIPNRDAAEICRRLAADPALKRVPVVVMVARGQGDDVESRFAKASNVVDFIGKPFSPDALQALVAHVVGKRTSAGGGREHDLGRRDPRVGRRARRRRGGAVALGGRGGRRSAGASPAAGQALAGDLDAISMSEVLELLAEQGQSGILRVVNTETNARIEIYFRSGRVDFAAAVGVARRVPARPLRRRRRRPDAARRWTRCWRARAKSSAAVPLFGADLIARGLVTRDALTRAMVRQTSELAYEALRWRAGFFQFRRTEALSLLRARRRAGDQRRSHAARRLPARRRMANHRARDLELRRGVRAQRSARSPTRRAARSRATSWPCSSRSTGGNPFGTSCASCAWGRSTCRRCSSACAARA